MFRPTSLSPSTFRPGIVPNTKDKRAQSLSRLAIFASALYHIHTHTSAPAQWNWSPERFARWKTYVGEQTVDIWAPIASFAANVNNEEGQFSRFGTMIWALVTQVALPAQKPWSRIFERFVFTSFVNAKSMAAAIPQFHLIQSMATVASEMSWIARAPAIAEVSDAAAAAPADVGFEYAE